MTKTQLFAILTAMTATAHNILAYEIRLEPDAAKRRTVTIYRSQGPETAMLYLYAPTPWVIAGSAITAQDDNLWSGFNTTPDSPTHIYRMVNAHSSQQYVSIFGFLTQPGQGEGTPPWFRATVPSVDIDWEQHAGAGHESDEDAWTGVCPVTTNQSQRTKVIVRKLKDDRSLVAPSMTLECWPTDAARFLKEDGVTALWSGATVSDSETPLTLYVDPQKTGPFQVTLSGPVDDAFNRPTDYLTGKAVAVDLDVDADNDGAIGDADDPLEEAPGGILATGAVKQVCLKLEPDGLTGKLTLSAVSGGSRIRVWQDAGRTTEVTLPKEWTLAGGGYPFPPALYVEGVAASASARDVQLRLRYTAADGTTYCDDDIRLTVVKVEMVTPDGDPVNSPVDGGDGSGSVPDGANEFTFSTASSGVLTLKLKARVTPSGVAAQIKDLCHFTVDTIGSSALAWDAANPSGKPTASGDNLLATVTFTGLPANNTAFGSKKAAVYFNVCKQDEKSYEVFYPRDTVNHPGGQSGSPNWFHYWCQAISANNISYAVGSSLYGECPGMLHWSYSTSQDKDGVIVYDTAATEDPGDANADHGKKATTGIDTFEDTYLHEHYHTVQIDQADNVVGIIPNTPWRYGWSWNQSSSHNHWSKGTDGQPGVAGTDDDTNGTTDDLIVSGPGELGNGDDVLLDSGYSWPQAFGSLPPTPWAGGGPIEDQAYNQEPDNENARASVDWGDPGKQHKTLNKYDD